MKKTMKKTMKKRISGFMVMIAILAGITAGAEAAATWLDAIVIEEPTKVAIDKTGNMYVTEAIKDRLSIYDRNGNLIKTISRGLLDGPIGIAVDSAGKIYIGNDYACNVVIYNPDYTFNSRIGGTSCSPVKEADRPNSIAVTSNGDIYVVNTKADKVKVYNADGSPKFTFGESGMGDGKFNFPLDMVIDETAGELYVADLGIFLAPDGDGNPIIPTAGARVQAFNLNGEFIRSFGTYGIGQNLPDGVMTRLGGIAVDKLGRLSVTDTYQGKVHIFNRLGNTLGSINIHEEHPLNTPMGIAVGQDERMHIVSTNGTPPTLEIYGLEDYTSLGVTPKEITISGYEGGTAGGKDITISNSGDGDMLWWTQKEAGSEITLSKESGQTGGTASETVTVGADLGSLAEGTYTRKFKVIADGAEEEVTVTLQVATGGTLEVSPLALTYTGQAGGSQPLAQTVTITLSGGDISWTATSNAPSWLSINPATGNAGAAVQASVTVDITGLAAAEYNSSITITADGATGSPAEVNVKLILSSAGKIEVTTNIAEANWNISGEAAYQGSGMQWSQQDAPSGQYQISFTEVSGYLKPQDQTFTVQSGNTTTIDVQYKDLKAMKKIIAGLGSGNKKNPAEIKILSTDGSIAGADFMAFSLLYGVNVAAGDIDGDGADEIIVGTGIRKGNSSNIRVFKNIDGVITDTGINSIVDTSRYGVYVAAGDIDGDGTDEIITGAGPDKKIMATVRILKADASAGIGGWTATEINAIIVNEPKTGAVVAAGDLNGDGKAEILAGSCKTLDVKIYNADGSPYGVGITETDKHMAKMYKKGASIAAGDTDDDGIAEIVIGTGPNKNSPAEIRIYSAGGALIDSFISFSQFGGVNVGLGELE